MSTCWLRCLFEQHAPETTSHAAELKDGVMTLLLQA